MNAYDGDSGRVSTNRVRFASDPTAIVPPWAFAISETIYSPSPRPCWLPCHPPKKLEQTPPSLGGNGRAPLLTASSNVSPVIASATTG